MNHNCISIDGYYRFIVLEAYWCRICSSITGPRNKTYYLYLEQCLCRKCSCNTGQETKIIFI